MSSCTLNTLFLLIGITIIGITILAINNRKLTLTETPEKFSDIGNAVLVDKARETVEDKYAVSMNTPCRIKTQDGTDFQFKVGTHELGWFQVQNKPNTCAIEISGKDLQGDPQKCSKQNPTLFDNGKVVTNMYWNDLDENKRCEVNFSDKPNKADLEAYMKKQESYKVVTDCDKAIIEAERLKKEKALLNQQLDNLKKEEDNLRNQIKKTDSAIKQAQENVQKLKDQKAQLRKQIIATQTQLADVNRQIDRAEEDIKRLEAQYERTESYYDRQLLNSQLALAKKQKDNAEILSKKGQAELAETNRLVGVKNQEISSVNARVNAAQEQQRSINSQINAVQQQQNQLKSQINQKEQEIANFKPPVQTSVPPPTPKVVLYQACNYDTGNGYYEKTLDIGKYTFADLQARGIKNDDLSAIRVYGGAVAILFEHDNFRGNTLVADKDIPCFVNYGFNDVVTSIIVTQQKPSNNRLFKSSNRANFCLDISGVSRNAGARTHAWECHGGGNQRFTMDNKGRIVVQHSGQCLDVYNFNTANGAAVVQWPCHDGENQKWYFDEQNRIHSVLVPNKCLDISANSKNNGAPIIMSDCHDGPNQKWNTGFVAPGSRTTYSSLGCWADTGDRAIPTAEGTDPLLDGAEYWNRRDPVNKCFEVAKKRGADVFAVQHGGWCATSDTASATYKKYGVSTNCANGTGGVWANDVYEIK
jgi:predicted  nucleic acid-binding Zn-ribbon protein